eukprot:scaffold208996_cov43-Tisochrysis_lutea.AAC.1
MELGAETRDIDCTSHRHQLPLQSSCPSTQNSSGRSPACTMRHLATSAPLGAASLGAGDTADAEGSLEPFGATPMGAKAADMLWPIDRKN